MKKSERLNQELIFLSGKAAFQLNDLMAEFGISKRTALRDVAELESLGLPLYAESGRYGGYRLISQKPFVPVYFTIEEVEAIFFAMKALKLLSSTPFSHSFEHIRQKLLATLPQTQQATISKLLSVIDYHSVPPVKAVAHLDLIVQAILDQQVLVGRNLQKGDQPVALQIGELFYRSGVWFCSAWDRLTKKWGTYRCDYLVDLTIQKAAEETFTLAELREIQQRYETHYHDRPFRCRLTDFGKELVQKNHYPNMSLEEKDGMAYLVGGYHEEELGYMTHYLVSLGRHVVVEAPKELRDSVQAEYRQILAQYES